MTLVNPGRQLGERITVLTGITDDMVKDAPAIEDMIGDVVRFCGNLPLLGHNILFDYAFLKRAAVNSGLDFEREGIDTLGHLPAVYACGCKTEFDLRLLIL